MQPNDVIIVEIDGNGKIIGSFHNKNGPVSSIFSSQPTVELLMQRSIIIFQISHSSEVRVGKEFTFFGSASAKNIYKMKTADLKL